MTEKDGNLPKNYFIIHNGGEIMLILEKGFIYESVKQNKTIYQDFYSQFPDLHQLLFLQ